MGGLKDELLKAIWHAFTALDLDHSGKVSKSQLKVGAPAYRGPALAPTQRVLYYHRVEAGRRAVTIGNGGPECGRAACSGWREPRPGFGIFRLPLAFGPRARTGALVPSGLLVSKRRRGWGALRGEPVSLLAREAQKV